MNAEQLYRQIWARKLEVIEPPERQHIDRCRWVAELMPTGKRDGPFLDIGCGSGALLAEADRRDWYEADGVDIDQALVDWLIDQGYGALKLDIDSDDLPKTWGDTFGIAASCDVIEHLYDPGHMLAEAFRVLRPGGRIYVGTPNASHWRRVQSLVSGRMFRTSGDDGGKDGGHIGYWGPVDLADALKGAGFSGVNVHFRNRDPVDGRLFEALAEIVAVRRDDVSFDPHDNRWSNTYLIAEGCKP